jgi:hypothetical protein
VTPSVGRIVHFYPSRPNGKAQPYPAVITHVWTGELVNLRLLDDADFAVGAATSTPAVSRCPRGHVETGGEDRAYWDWPPRV